MCCTLFLSAQFGYEPFQTNTPIDSTMLWIEAEVISIDTKIDLEKVLLPDSLWNKLSFSNREKIEVGYLFLHHTFPWDTVPQTYIENGGIVKIE